MLKPSKLDPNYKAEMERRERDPLSFGMLTTPPVATATKPETITTKKEHK